MIDCSQCGTALSGGDEGGPVAAISAGIMGDEYTESWYFCPTCQVYTVAVYHDRFSGEDDVGIRGPVDKPKGDAKVAIILRCPEPGSKRCRCPAHREYFGGWLD